jgi:hypothetical protein
MGSKMEGEMAEVQSEKMKFIWTHDTQESFYASLICMAESEPGKYNDKNRDRKKFYLWFLLPFHFCFFTFLVSCDNTFQPLQQNDQFYFSIQGYLDATIDTQWVRISLPREQVDTSPEIPPMNVTLEHLESGVTAVLNDTLVFLAQAYRVLNSWTDMSIEPGQTYRLRAERPDGGLSSVTVSIPGEFPTPRMQYEVSGFGSSASVMYRLILEGVEKLADVQSVWHIREFGTGQEKLITFPYRNEAFETGSGSFNVILFPEEEESQVKEQVLASGSGTSGNDLPFEILNRQVFIASGGPEWDDSFTSMDDLVYTLPESLSNIENGLGYLVGIVSKTIPYQSCFDGEERLTACPEVEPLFQIKEMNIRTEH